MTQPPPQPFVGILFDGVVANLNGICAVTWCANVLADDEVYAVSLTLGIAPVDLLVCPDCARRVESGLLLRRLLPLPES